MITGLRNPAALDALKTELERFGPLQNCFLQPGSGTFVRATYVNLQDAHAAHAALAGRSFEFGRLGIRSASDKKAGGGGAGGRASSVASGSKSGQREEEEEEDPNKPRPLAPAPRIIENPAQNTASGAASTSASATDQALVNLARDTWEISLEDSDYDDGFIPYKPSNKPKPVTVQEWKEAFDLLKSFPHHGGAILAVDVESWDQDHDYIIEVGLAHVNYMPGSGKAPKVRAEHIIISENEDKRNGVYSADAREHYAFGTSKHKSEFDTSVYLRFLMQKYSADQPLVLLFHNAAAEKGYFELLDIPLSKDCVEAIPRKLLSAGVHIARHDDGATTPRGPERSSKIILDTQRLYKAFVLDENERNPKLGLANICKKLGIHTKHLHNAGNDALYTLKVLYALAEKQMQRNKVKAEEEAEFAQWQQA